MNNRHFFYLLCGCVLFTLIYSPANLYFLSDDFDSLLFSLTPANILHSFRPLSDASLLLDYSVWKMNGEGFHFTNLLFHFSCVFCFYHFAKIIFLLRNDDAVAAKRALVSSLFFLFYPFHSEALFWIVGRGAVLCTLFGLLCFIFYLKKDKMWLYYPLSLTCFLASLLSYEEAWIIPVVITLFALLYQQKKISFSISQASSFWLLFLFYLGGRYYFTNDIIGTPYGSERMITFSTILFKNVAALVFRSFVVPMQSSVAFSVTCAVVAVLAIALLIFYRKKLNLVAGISIACFLITLIPVTPLGIDTHDTESERFLYFPSVFLVIFLVQFFNIVLAKKVWLVYAVIVAGGTALWQSYESFAMSSVVCKTTINTIGKIAYADTIFCKQLPGQYKGAFIFRNGFESAVRLVTKDSATEVNILSRSELYHPQKNYQETFTDKSFHQPKHNIYIEWKENEIVVDK